MLPEMPPVYWNPFQLSRPKLDFFQVIFGGRVMYERIWNLAKAQGISIPALEEMVGVSQSTIGKWKHSVPKVDAVYRVAQVLHTTVEYLYTGIERPATLANDGRLDKIISLLQSADPRLVEAVAQILESAESNRTVRDADKAGE